MFVGHWGAALAAKRVAPKAPLSMLVLAVFWADLLWPALVLAGVEIVRIDPGNTAVTPLAFDHYPVSHSLLLDLFWGALVGGWVLWRVRDRRAAVVTGVAVVSHWVLDWITHAPDMPLWPGGPRVGLGLWNSVAGTIAVEGAILLVGLVLYLRATRPRDGTGRWAFVALNVLFVAIWVANLLGPPPPSVSAVAVAGLSLWLLVPWSAWIERHRVVPTGHRPTPI